MHICVPFNAAAASVRATACIIVRYVELWKAMKSYGEKANLLRCKIRWGEERRNLGGRKNKNADESEFAFESRATR